MKNISEVAVFDLGRPFSTSSQLSVDEPDAQATPLAKDIIKRTNKIHAEHRLPRAYKPEFREYHDQLIPAPGQPVFLTAIAELAA